MGGANRHPRLHCVVAALCGALPLKGVGQESWIGTHGVLVGPVNRVDEPPRDLGAGVACCTRHYVVPTEIRGERAAGAPGETPSHRPASQRFELKVCRQGLGDVTAFLKQDLLADRPHGRDVKKGHCHFRSQSPTRELFGEHVHHHVDHANLSGLCRVVVIVFGWGLVPGPVPAVGAVTLRVQPEDRESKYYINNNRV